MTSDNASSSAHNIDTSTLEESQKDWGVVVVVSRVVLFKLFSFYSTLHLFSYLTGTTYTT